jgi:serine/threonine-protein kinase
MVGHLLASHRQRMRFQIDFSLTVLVADRATRRRPFTPTRDFFGVECDPAPPPLPEGGALEGEHGYHCASDGDCHLLVVDRAACRLYEMWRADLRGDGFFGGCQAVWDISRIYPPSGRGHDCSSADAAGLPIASLLFTADEVATGEVRHALRFVLPNQHIRRSVYVAPATHSTSSATGPAASPPYGARFRLKATADLSRLNPGARVVARALQTYGMFLADGGGVAFTAASDAYSEHQWNRVGLGPHDLKPLEWSDFEVVDGGPRRPYRGRCQRSQVSD